MRHATGHHPRHRLAAGRHPHRRRSPAHLESLMNLAAVVDSHPGDWPALVERDRVITYGQLRERVAAIRGGLSARGIRAGQPVGLIGPNGVELVEAYLALLGLGAM